MRGATHSVVPRGMGYIIERTSKTGKLVLSMNGDPFKFANRANADAYAKLCDADEIITRNDQWMPVAEPRTIYQGGSLAPSIRHAHSC